MPEERPDLGKLYGSACKVVYATPEDRASESYREDAYALAIHFLKNHEQYQDRDGKWCTVHRDTVIVGKQASIVARTESKPGEVVVLSDKQDCIQLPDWAVTYLKALVEHPAIDRITGNPVVGPTMSDLVRHVNAQASYLVKMQCGFTNATDRQADEVYYYFLRLSTKVGPDFHWADFLINNQN